MLFSHGLQLNQRTSAGAPVGSTNNRFLALHIDHLTVLRWIGAPVEISNLASVFDTRAGLLFLLPSGKAGSPFMAPNRPFPRGQFHGANRKLDTY